MIEEGRLPVSRTVAGDDVTSVDNARSLPTWALWLLALSAFGPYLAPGIRTDSGLVWLALPLAVLALVAAPMPPHAVLVVLSWTVMVAVALWSHLTPSLNTSGYNRGNLLAGVDTFVAPLIALSLGMWFVRRLGPVRVFTIVGQAVMAGMVLNAALALAQSQSSTANRAIGRLWGLALDDSTLARAETVDRFSGMMQQPALAGTMYGVALIVGTHLLARKPALRDALWLVLACGAALSASKAFWLVALPIAVILRVVQQRRGIPAGLVRSAVLLGLVGLVARLLGVSLTPMVEMLRSAGADVREAVGGGVGGATGNRFGEQGVVLDLATTVLRDDPVAGYGISGLATATDSGLLQALVVGGLVGLALYCIVLLVLVYDACVGLRGNGELGDVFVALSVAVAVWSVGFPTLTGNRISTILWLLFAVMLTGAYAARSGQSQDGRPRRTDHGPRDSVSAGH